VFICAAGISIAAAIAAKFLLAPMRKRWINNTVLASENGSYEVPAEARPASSSGR
jgi:OFA family oxalate/formate antiporter-like MFS transporter